MLEELVLYLEKKANFLDISNMLFFNNYFGVILDNKNDHIVHFHGDYRLDFRTVLDYGYINQNRMKIKHLQLDKIIADPDLLGEILNALVGNRKPRSDVKIVKRQLYTFIYFNVDLQNRNPNEGYPRLKDNTKSPGRTLSEKLRSTVRNMGKSASVLSQFNIFKNNKNIFNRAFNPGLTKVKIQLFFIFQKLEKFEKCANFV